MCFTYDASQIIYLFYLFIEKLLKNNRKFIFAKPCTKFIYLNSFYSCRKYKYNESQIQTYFKNYFKQNHTLFTTLINFGSQPLLNIVYFVFKCKQTVWCFTTIICSYTPCRYWLKCFYNQKRNFMNEMNTNMNIGKISSIFKYLLTGGLINVLRVWEQLLIKLSLATYYIC